MKEREGREGTEGKKVIFQRRQSAIMPTTVAQ